MKVTKCNKILHWANAMKGGKFFEDWREQYIVVNHRCCSCFHFKSI